MSKPILAMLFHMVCDMLVENIKLITVIFLVQEIWGGDEFWELYKTLIKLPEDFLVRTCKLLIDFPSNKSRKTEIQWII